MPGPNNATEARWLDSDLDRVASGGKFRLALYKHATGVALTMPNEDGSLPSGLSEASGNGYSSPVVNDSGVSANSEWSAAVPGAPTVKGLPNTGSKSFGTFTAPPQSGSEAFTCMAIIDRVVRTSISLTTVNGSATVTVGGGATVTNADLGRAVGSTAVGATPSGSIAIPTGAVVGEIIDSTHFIMYKDGAPVNATNGVNGNAGTASVTLGEIILYSYPYWDATATYSSPPNVTTVNNSNQVTFATALTAPLTLEGATIAGTGIPANTQLIYVSADGLSGLLSKNATASGTVVPTITGKATTKTYVTNDNPIIDSSNKLYVKVGDGKDPF